MSLTHFRFLPVLLCLGVAACDQGETPIGGFDDDGCMANDDGGEERQAMVVDCSFYYAGEQQAVRFEPVNQESEDTLTTVTISETLVVEAALWDDEFEGRSFSIRVFSPEGTSFSSTLYQTGPARPRNEFWGDHGFTGLNQVRDPGNPDENLQYACHASDPADPIHEWED